MPKALHLLNNLVVNDFVDNEIVDAILFNKFVEKRRTSHEIGHQSLGKR